MESYAGVVEAHYGPKDADPGSLESHHGAIVAQPRAIKSSWSRRGTHWSQKVIEDYSGVVMAKLR
jgi:hypothetical protein